MPYEKHRFPFVASLDTKVSEAASPTPKLLVAENVFADRTGALRKRRGVSTLSGLAVDNSGTSASGALVPFRDGLVAMPDNATTAFGLVREYSVTAGRWAERGESVDGHLEAEAISAGTQAAGQWKAETAVSDNGYVLTAFICQETSIDATQSNIFVALQDALGVFLCQRVSIQFLNSSTPYTANLRVVAKGNQFYVFYQTSNNINVWLCDTTSAATITTALGANLNAPASAVTVATDSAAVTPCLFDVDVNPTYGVFLVYRTTTADQIKRGFVNASGTLTNTATDATTGAVTLVATSVALGDHALHGIVYCKSTASDIQVLFRSWSGSAWSSPVTANAIETFTGGTVVAVGCIWDSSTVLRVYYSADQANGPAPNASMGSGASTDTATHVTYQATVNTSASVATRLVALRRSILASRPFVVLDQNSRQYYWVIVGQRTSNSVQPSQYLVQSSNSRTVAHIHQATAAQITHLGHNPPAVAVHPGGGYIVALPYITRPINGYATSNTSANRSTRLVTWKLSHPQSHQMVEIDGTLYLAGSILQQYSGHSFRENGFLRYVESDVIGMVPGTGGSMTSSATYYYKIIPEWVNEAGKREQGTNTGPTVSIVLSASETKVDLGIPFIAQSVKRHVFGGDAEYAPRPATMVFAIYRTVANPASSSAAYFRVGEVGNFTIGQADRVAFIDGMSDANAQQNEQIYLGTGEVDHIAPPSAHIACYGAGRMFLAGIPDQPNTIWFSLLRSGDDALSFNDSLTLQVPDRGGDIVALAIFRESLVVFEERAIYRISGYGPDNVLSSGSFSDPELIVDQIGCTGQRSVVVSKMGVAFQSPRGFQLLTEAWEVDYFGVVLEGLTGSQAPTNTVNGAVVLSQEQQIRFTSASVVWVFDYYHSIWTVYTGQNIGGPSCEALLGGTRVHAWLDTTGSLLVNYEDDAQYWSTTNMRAVMAWARLSSLQDDMMVGRIGVTGSAAGTPNLRVKAYKNLKSSSALMTKTESALPAGPFYKAWRAPDALRMASTLEVEIDDNASSSGRLSLNEIVVELMPRGAPLTDRQK